MQTAKLLILILVLFLVLNIDHSTLFALFGKKPAEIQPVELMILEEAVWEPAETQPKTTSLQEKIKIINERDSKNPAELAYSEKPRLIEISSCSYSENGINMQITWQEGHKVLFSFKGVKYSLHLIDKNGDGEVDQVNFACKDTRDDNLQVAIKKTFEAPLAPPLKETLDLWLVQALDLLADDKTAPAELKQFNLPSFYADYVKSAILEKLK